jgi:hypothetical protein
MRTRVLFVALWLVATPSAAAAQAEDPARLERLRRAEETFAREPSYRDTAEAAMRHLRLHPEAIEHVRSRLRSKAGAPLLIVSGFYQHAESARAIHIGPGTFRDTDDDWQGDWPRATALLSFNLPDGVFTPAELQTYALADLQLQLLTSVNMWYFYRRHYGLRLMVDPPEDPRARTSLELRIRGFSALLDVATGGWFSGQLPEGSI